MLLRILNSDELQLYFTRFECICQVRGDNIFCSLSIEAIAAISLTIRRLIALSMNYDEEEGCIQE
jgi:hypothetical protein